MKEFTSDFYDFDYDEKKDFLNGVTEIEIPRGIKEVEPLTFAFSKIEHIVIDADEDIEVWDSAFDAMDHLKQINSNIPLKSSSVGEKFFDVCHNINWKDYFTLEDLSKYLKEGGSTKNIPNDALDHVDESYFCDDDFIPVYIYFLGRKNLPLNATQFDPDDVFFDEERVQQAIDITSEEGFVSLTAELLDLQRKKGFKPKTAEDLVNEFLSQL